MTASRRTLANARWRDGGCAAWLGASGFALAWQKNSESLATLALI